MKKGLILYYSYEGFTDSIAAKLAEVTDFDICRIKPVKERRYSGFLKYLVLGFQAFMKTTPELRPLSCSPSDYDSLILGSPIWAGSFTPYLRSVINRVNLDGKKIYSFFCNRGGATDQALTELKEILPGSIILDNQVFTEPGDREAGKRSDSMDEKIQYFGTLIKNQEGGSN